MNKKLSLKNAVIGIGIICAVVLAVVGFRYAKEDQQSQNVSQSYAASKVKGPDSAAIRIIGFSDFQCPACAHAGPIVDELMKKYPGKIQYVFKHFPLRMHVWSPIAHQAAECVSEQGFFWDYYKKLYGEQAVWAALPDPMVALAGYAQELGVNMQVFAGCMADSQVAERIMAEKQEGVDLEVRSTPTFFINGKMFAGPMELQNAGEDWIRSLLGLEHE